LSKLIEILARERLLLAQKREIKRLREEVAQLEARNERIRSAMRRCTTCEYRLEVIGRS
jgi:uncharacterized protein with PIN domain